MSGRSKLASFLVGLALVGLFVHGTTMPTKPRSARPLNDIDGDHTADGKDLGAGGAPATFPNELPHLGREAPEATFPNELPHPGREAPEALRRAAEGGDAAAATKLGLAYELGWNVSHDASAAHHWFALAAKAKEPHAIMRLGRIVEVPEHGVPQDLERARELYEEAAALGDPFAISRLHARGWRAGGFEEALRWAKVAAERGDPLAFHYVWKYLDQGLGTERDPASAERWTHRGVLRGDLRSLHIKGFAARRAGLLDQAFVWFEEAALRGAPYAQHQVAEAYLGARGVPPDLVAARSWALKSAHGEAAGAGLAGFLLLNGIGGPRDEKRAVVLLLQAARLGAIDPAAHLAWVMAGSGDPSAPAKARLMLEEVVAQGGPEVAVARHVLARFLADGLGGPADPARARALLVGLEWNGPRNDLAVLLLLGRGGPADAARARSLLEQSAGHPVARTNLALLLERLGEAQAAVPHWRNAADQGEPYAVVRVAALLEEGTAPPRFPGEAALWRARAARAPDPPVPFLFSGPCHLQQTAAEEAEWWREGFAAGSVQDGVTLLRRSVQGGREAGDGAAAMELLKQLRATPRAEAVKVVDEEGTTVELLVECARLEADLLADGAPGVAADFARAQPLYERIGTKDARALLHLALRAEARGELDLARSWYRRAAADPRWAERALACEARVARHAERRPVRPPG